MNNEIVVSQQNNPINYTREQIDVIKKTIAKDATDTELALFINQCKRTGLDAMTRQIYFMKKDGKVTIQTSVDGFRLIAERSDKYEGQTKAEWCGQDGVWKDIWLSEIPPAAARIGVYKKGFREALYATAIFDEYAQKYNGKLGFMWAKMPSLMIAKVAECLALRKAFPNDLSGLYAQEEMQQAENTPARKEIESVVMPEVKQNVYTPQVMQSNVILPQVNPADVLSPEDYHSQPNEDFSGSTSNGSYVCQVGKKYKGQTLDQMGFENVKSYKEYIVRNAKEKNEQVTGQWLEFVIEAEKYTS